MTNYMPFYPQYSGPPRAKGEREYTPVMSGPGGEIVRAVAAAYKVSPKDLCGRSQRRRYAWPRQELMWRLHETGRYSLSQIGAFLGGRDHTTVLHGIREHAKRMEAAR
jgi:chromosomal replication initiator protein